MKTVTPCLWFDGNAEEAAEFYVSLVPGSKVTEISRYGPDMPLPEGTVMTVSFELAGSEYVALNGGPEYQFTPAFSLQLWAADQDEIDRYWTLLSDGGKPLACGWMTDRFGLCWQVIPAQLPALMSDPDPARARAAQQALMKMSKIDLGALREAADSAAPAAT